MVSSLFKKSVFTQEHRNFQSTFENHLNGAREVMMNELDVEVEGLKLHVYDTSHDGATNQLVVFWHHGTPCLGTPPAPLSNPQIRWVSYDRPSYGGSSTLEGRNAAHAAKCVTKIADELHIDKFAVMGYSGGGPHALAVAALLPTRVIGVVTVASLAPLAPFSAEGLDWYAGMVASGAQALRAAGFGRKVKKLHEMSGVEYDMELTPADERALQGEWKWLDSVVTKSIDGVVDDDIAYVTPWGFDPATIKAPLLLMHGKKDGIIPVSHARWLATHITSAELREFDDDGHLSILTASPAAIPWLLQLHSKLM